MKILHIISSGGMYGAEAVILNMSRVLNVEGHCSAIGVFSNSSNPNLQLHESAVGEGMESNLISCKGQLDRSVIASIRELAVRMGADIVHAHGYKADIYTYLALRRSRVALVSTCHTWYDNDFLVSLYGKVDRFALRRFARVVAVSEEVKQRLLKAGVQDGKIFLVENGIDLRPFEGVVPSLRGEPGVSGSLLVGLVGRLSREKGVDIFLRAAASVLGEFPGARFVVVGEGPDRDKLESLIDELGIRGSVAMLGRRGDMPSVYASLDVMVSSSRQEGLPMAILEGMASRLPLVATAVGEVPAVVVDGQTGLLVAPENVVDLAAAILKMLRDPGLRKRLGDAARQLVEEKYSAKRMTADYLRVYEAALAGTAGFRGTR
jgi:glycosyltransferase involved in cell wall biosynthesis